MSWRGRSLGVAFQRVGRGWLGWFCVIWPFAFLYYYYYNLAGGRLILFWVVLLGAYLIAILKIRSQGSRFIWAVSRDTLLTFIFAGVGGAIVGMMATSGGPELSDAGGLIVSFLIFPTVGFWILEAIGKDKGR